MGAGVVERLTSWVRRVLGPTEKVVRRYPLPQARPVLPPPARHTSPTKCALRPARHITEDRVTIHLDELVMSVERNIDLNIPFEVTVVVPRAEVSETYSQGELVQRTLVYSSITIAHSPRFEGLGGTNHLCTRPWGTRTPSSAESSKT